MHGVTRFSALAVTAMAVVVVLVVALAWLEPAREGVASSSSSLFDEELVQEVYRRVSPAVVVVKADRKSGDFFACMAFGSGLFIDKEGHIATNYHVMRGAGRVLLDFQDGTSAEAEVLGTNPANDLALLKVDAALVGHIEPVEPGDSSQVRPGQMAIATGSPFGLGDSVTVGIIGGIDRTLGSDIARPIHGVLQTDALTNPGDSGGLLLNRGGRLLGINNAVRIEPLDPETQRASRPVGFALPVNTPVRLLPRLKERRVIRPAFLGIAAVPVSAVLAQRLDLPAQTGVYVTRVLFDSSAQRAGLVPSGTLNRNRLAAGGDIIVSVDGVPVLSVAGFFAELDRNGPGDKVALSVIRGGGGTEVKVSLGEWLTEGNLFIDSPTLPLEGPDGALAPRYPLVPAVPGFPFPDLFSENPRR